MGGHYMQYLSISGRSSIFQRDINEERCNIHKIIKIWNIIPCFINFPNVFMEKIRMAADRRWKLNMRATKSYIMIDRSYVPFKHNEYQLRFLLHHRYPYDKGCSSTRAFIFAPNFENLYCRTVMYLLEMTLKAKISRRLWHKSRRTKCDVMFYKSVRSVHLGNA